MTDTTGEERFQLQVWERLTKLHESTQAAAALLRDQGDYELAIALLLDVGYATGVVTRFVRPPVIPSYRSIQGHDLSEADEIWPEHARNPPESECAGRRDK